MQKPHNKQVMWASSWHNSSNFQLLFHSYFCCARHDLNCIAVMTTACCTCKYILAIWFYAQTMCDNIWSPVLKWPHGIDFQCEIHKYDGSDNRATTYCALCTSIGLPIWISRDDWTWDRNWNIYIYKWVVSVFIILQVIYLCDCLAVCSPLNLPHWTDIYHEFIVQILWCTKILQCVHIVHTSWDVWRMGRMVQLYSVSCLIDKRY